MPRNPSPESLEALEAGDKAGMEKLVLAYIRQCRGFGATADEACEALEMGHNSVAPRFVALQKSGLIVKLHDRDGKRVRRETRLGCFAGVHVAVEFSPKHTSTQTSFAEFLQPKEQGYPD